MGKSGTQNALEVSEEQVLYFRAQRGGLAGAGAADPVAAAGAILGGQAQQEAPALLALGQRTQGRPTADLLKTLLWEDRTLVRTWGQRETVHVYDVADWPDIVAARALWAPGGRRGSLATDEDMAAAREVLEDLDGPITRKDMYAAVTDSFANELAPIAETARQAPRHFAAGRLIWQLSNAGDLCTIYKQGNQQAYAYRKHWLPELEWPEEVDPTAAAARLTRRYLAVYGPASVQDIGHFFGARITEVRRWVAQLHAEDALSTLTCGDRKNLLLCHEDAEDLQEAPPTTAKGWPVRLLPLWDSMLMGHADKRWTVPDEAERKLVWKKAAMVCAVVLARGKIVGTWSQKARKRALDVAITPLGAWQTRRHKAAVVREANTIAAHLGLEEAQVAIKS